MRVGAFRPMSFDVRTLAGVGVAVVASASFIAMSVVRFVDVDEGTYAVAAELVGHGQLPYVDFLYVQMPLVPYVYAGWIKVAGESWYAVRLLSALLAAAVAVLLYLHLARRFGVRIGILAALLYGAAGLVIVWYPTVKTYALSTLLLFVAYLFLQRAKSGGRWVAAGILAGLAVDTRLMFAAPLVVFFWAALRSRVVPPARAIATFAAGLIAGLLPSLVLLAVDPDRFLFGNIRYHGLKSEGGLIGDLDQKARVAAALVGVGADANVQFFLLVLLASVAVLAQLSTVGAGGLSEAFPVAGLLLAASLVATPTYSQYACTAVPFLAVGIAEFFGELLQRRDASATLLRLLRPAVVVWLVVYVAAGAVDARREAVAFPDQRIPTVEAAARALEHRTDVGEQVAASWPGYVFGTHARPVPGLETDFAPPAASRLSAGDAKKYRMARVDDVEELLRSGGVRLAIVKRWHAVQPQPDWERALADGGYRVVVQLAKKGRAEVGGPVRVYERRAGPTGTP